MKLKIFDPASDDGKIRCMKKKEQWILRGEGLPALVLMFSLETYSLMSWAVVFISDFIAPHLSFILG